MTYFLTDMENALFAADTPFAENPTRDKCDEHGGAEGADDLKNHVLHIVSTLENPPLVLADSGDDPEDCPHLKWSDEDEEWQLEDGSTVETAPLSGFDYLSDILDIQYTVASDRTSFLGARVLVAFGGPNIWIDTQNCTVDGYWASDKFSASFRDNMGLNETCKELFQC